MPKRKSRASQRKPILPFKEDYIWVETKESSFWRRKRGSVKPAALNETFKKNAALLKLTAPAAKRVIGKLNPFMRGLNPGRINLRISNLFRTELKKFDAINFSTFRNFDFQQKFTLDELLPALQLKQTNSDVSVNINVDHTSFPYKTALVTDYYFDLILLYGNPLIENELTVECSTSRLFSFSKKAAKHRLTISLPKEKKPGIVLLKANCLEGNELAVHPRHYALGVVALQ